MQQMRQATREDLEQHLASDRPRTAGGSPGRCTTITCHLAELLQTTPSSKRIQVKGVFLLHRHREVEKELAVLERLVDVRLRNAVACDARHTRCRSVSSCK